MRWAQYVDIHLPAPIGVVKLSDELYHVPNGGKRNFLEAAKLKEMGVKAGVPDLSLDIACGHFHGARWELKAGKNKPTDLQVRWHERLRAKGYYVQTFWDWQACGDDILKYLNRGPYQVVALYGVRQ